MSEAKRPKNPPPAKTRQIAVAGFSLKPVNEITQNPPTCHGNQQASITNRAAEAVSPSKEAPRPAPAAALSPRTRQLLGLFEEDLRVRYAGRTTVEYVSMVRQLLAWLAARGCALGDVRTADLAAYQEALYQWRKRDGAPYSLGAQANHLKAMKSLFRFLYRRGYVLSDPAAAVEYPRLPQALPHVILTEAEVRRILAAPDTKTLRGLRDRAILELFYATGIRASELAGLRVPDVDIEEHTVRVLQGKGRKDRYVPLTREAGRAIRAYLERARGRLLPRRGSARLFVAGPLGRLSRPLLSAIVKRWTKKAKVKKTVTCHTFRHTIATHLLRRRADVRHIQSLLGHASLATTERYTRVEISDLRKVFARAHPRGR